MYNSYMEVSYTIQLHQGGEAVAKQDNIATIEEARKLAISTLKENRFIGHIKIIKVETRRTLISIV